ncbi:DNA end-binding protein Ku [Chryseolinea serpens]|jgi:DNA end-binding protein Ku|uniref:Non-homologous end joining protein Ku n=1 Tax=Chryseolinea serpens TaxID=947013 RepID=A0A1M5VY43_9BACT|nr:Ku protein [Chryseolinea serpens]SHH80175.1 DNA end-binding protein Ku [Chryseolinea serpens]
MRAIWKGHIQFSLVTIPVRIYNAIDTGQTISFNLLSKEGHNPVSYEKKDKVTGQTLRQEDIVKGYQYETGQYVIIDNEDFAKVKLKSEKVIEIEGFVDATEVHPTLFETPYYIGPDGDIAAKTYGLLSETLKQSGKIAVGKVVLRDRETPLLLAPFEGGIVMYRLRYPSEVRSMREVPQLLEVKADKEQLKLAKTLVDSMTTKFANIEMKDHYYSALMNIIDAKIAGKEVVIVEEEEPKVVDIMTALKASIDAAKKPMEKAKGTTAAKAEKASEKAAEKTKTKSRKAS